MVLTPGFDLFRLPEEHQELRTVTRDLAGKQIAPYAVDVDENKRFPEEVLKALNEAGFNAVHVPEQFGGQGADSVAACIVIKGVARVCGPASLIPVVNELGTMGLILKDSNEPKSEVLPDIANGEMVPYALTKREAGSDAGSVKTRAIREDDEWVLNDSRCFITNSGRSTWYTVMAVVDPGKGANGTSAFMVYKDDESFRVGGLEHKLGIEGSLAAELYFEDCHIPADRIIGDEGTGFKTTLGTPDRTRPTIGAQALDITQGIYDYAVGYVQERQQFGKPIAAFQNTQFMLADIRMKIDTVCLVVYTAAANAERGTTEGGARLGLMAASAKAFISDVAMQVTADAMQPLGGYGFTCDFPVERMVRGAKIIQIYEDTNQIYRMVAGRQILADAQKR